MKKYAIFGVMLLMVYGVVMAVMWSKYEPRDEYIEFPSDFRDGIVELVPKMAFSQLSPETMHAPDEAMLTIEVTDPERFLALESYRPNGRGEHPSISISIEIEKDISGRNTAVLVTYGSVMYFTNSTSDAPFVDATSLRHTDRYAWPGQSNNWTAKHLTYTGGDFRFDNKGNMWFWTWITPSFMFVSWIWMILIFSLHKRNS